MNFCKFDGIFLLPIKKVSLYSLVNIFFPNKNAVYDSFFSSCLPACGKCLLLVLHNNFCEYRQYYFSIFKKLFCLLL